MAAWPHGRNPIFIFTDPYIKIYQILSNSKYFLQKSLCGHAAMLPWGEVDQNFSSCYTATRLFGQDVKTSNFLLVFCQLLNCFDHHWDLIDRCCAYISMILDQFIWPLLKWHDSTSPFQGLPPCYIATWQYGNHSIYAF